MHKQENHKKLNKYCASISYEIILWIDKKHKCSIFSNVTEANKPHEQANKLTSRIEIWIENNKTPSNHAVNVRCVPIINNLEIVQDFFKRQFCDFYFSSFLLLSTFHLILHKGINFKLKHVESRFRRNQKVSERDREKDNF